MGEFEDMFARRQRDMATQQARRNYDEEANFARLRQVGGTFLDYIKRSAYPQDMAPDGQFAVEGHDTAAWALFDMRHPYIGMSNVYLLSDGRVARIASNRDSDNFPIGGYTVTMLNTRPVSTGDTVWAIDLLQGRIDQLTTRYGI